MMVLALAAILAVPVGVSGETATIAELQVQLQKLQQVVAELQIQVSRLPYGLVKQAEEKSVQLERKMEKIERKDDDSDDEKRTVSVQACRVLGRNLRVGDSNGEVRLLKQYLAQAGFTTSDSEKFDEATASAVTGFQQKYAAEILTPLGLQYGTGYFGAATRAKLNMLYRCITPKPQSGDFRVISPNGGEIWKTGTKQVIRWSAPSFVQNVDIQLYPSVALRCLMPIVEACPTIAYPTYTIWKGVAHTGSFEWEVGRAHETSVLLTGQYVVRIQSSFDANSGTNVLSDISDASFTIIDSATSNQPPVIMKMGGPSSLKVNEAGTWTIGANDPEGGTLSYRVVWGDEVSSVSPSTSGVALEMRTTQTAMFTHAYASAGMYYPTFTVTDASGLSTTQKMSVRVGDATGQPDLSVLDIYDDAGKLSVKIGNLGSGYAPSNTGHLYIWIDGTLKWTYDLSTLYSQAFLMPGGTMVAQPQILSGTHTLVATIDPNGVIAESNEQNNSLTETLMFTPPPTVNQPPVVTGVSGPTVLRVGETGVWTVSAKDPESKSLKYVVSWGEITTTSGAAAESSVAPMVYTQNATFTHAYASAGGYTVSVRVYDDQGLSTMTSLTVNVTQ